MMKNGEAKRRSGGQGVRAFAGGKKRRMCRARTLKALRRLGGACEVDELLASERAKLAEVKGRVDRRHGSEGNGMSPTSDEKAREEASGRAGEDERSSGGVLKRLRRPSPAVRPRVIGSGGNRRLRVAVDLSFADEPPLNTTPLPVRKGRSDAS